MGSLPFFSSSGAFDQTSPEPDQREAKTESRAWSSKSHSSLEIV